MEQLGQLRRSRGGDSGDLNRPDALAVLDGGGQRLERLQRHGLLDLGRRQRGHHRDGGGIGGRVLRQDRGQGLRRQGSCRVQLIDHCLGCRLHASAPWRCHVRLCRLERLELGGVVLVVDDGRGRRDHVRQHEERCGHHDAEDPAPHGQAGGGQGRVPRFDRLGVRGHPWGVGGSDEDTEEAHHGHQRVVARVRMVRHLYEHVCRDNGADGTEHHERLADPDLVGDHPDDDEHHRVERPVPGVDAVGVRRRLVEHDGPVDDQHADRGVVDEEEQRDRQGRRDEVPLHHRAKRVGQGGLDIDTAGPRLDQGPLLHRDHQLVPELRGQVLQEEEGDHKYPHADDPREDELVLPRVQVVDGAGGDQAGHQAPHCRPQGPEPHGRAPSHLGGEVPDESRRHHQDDPLEEPDERVGDRELQAGMGIGDGKELDQPDDQHPEDGQVRPPDLVRDPTDERAERPDGVRHHQQPEEVGERHVEVRQEQRRRSADHVVEVVEDDRGHDHDAQVAIALAGRRVVVQLPIEEALAAATAVRRGPFFCCRLVVLRAVGGVGDRHELPLGVGCLRMCRRQYSHGGRDGVMAQFRAVSAGLPVRSVSTKACH